MQDVFVECFVCILRRRSAWTSSMPSTSPHAFLVLSALRLERARHRRPDRNPHYSLHNKTSYSWLAKRPTPTSCGPYFRLLELLQSPPAHRHGTTIQSNRLRHEAVHRCVYEQNAESKRSLGKSVLWTSSLLELSHADKRHPTEKLGGIPDPLQGGIDSNEPFRDSA